MLSEKFVNFDDSAIDNTNSDNNNNNNNNNKRDSNGDDNVAADEDSIYDNIIINNFDNNDTNLCNTQHNHNDNINSYIENMSLGDSGISLDNSKYIDYPTIQLNDNINLTNNQYNNSDPSIHTHSSDFENAFNKYYNDNNNIDENTIKNSIKNNAIDAINQHFETKINSISNILQRKSNVKKVYFDDQISYLPDIIESTGPILPSSSSSSSSSSFIAEENIMSTSGEENCDQMTKQHIKDKSPTDIIKLNNNIVENMEIEKKDLVNQESRYNAQLEHAEKQAIESRAKVNELTYKINELERNLTVKTWNVDRLQAELQAAYKEGECVRRKLNLQEDEMDALRARLSDTEYELSKKYDDLEQRFSELQKKLIQVQTLASALQIQLAEAQCDAAEVRKEKEKLWTDNLAEKKKLDQSLATIKEEREQMELKWQNEFEQLRTINSDREELLLQDCEWKLRSTDKSCKEKVVAAEKAKTEALQKVLNIENEFKYLKSFEAEVVQLRGLTNDQKESINSMTKRIDELKYDLNNANKKVTDSIESIRKIKVYCMQEISEKDRQMIIKIEEARYDVAVMWEHRLLEEMGRLKLELESCYAEDRAEALKVAHEQHFAELKKLTNTFSEKETELYTEIELLKNVLTENKLKIETANNKADTQIMQIRMILDKSERDHQRELVLELTRRDELMESLRQEYETEKEEMEEKFRERLNHIKEEFATELMHNREDLKAKHKKQMEQQWEKLTAEKEETIQDLQRGYKRQLIDSETKIRDLEIIQQRDIKDIQTAHDVERSTLQQRDLQNSQEIETLHKKCRCLTKLFEEMRMRYERRDPRAEDVREIQELRNRVEAQDQDLRKLAESLREIQMVQEQSQQNIGILVGPRKSKNRKNLNCEIIYEENEEHDSSPPPLPPPLSTNGNGTCINGNATNNEDNVDEDDNNVDDNDNSVKDE